jgi:hypothetical protein
LANGLGTLRNQHGRAVEGAGLQVSQGLVSGVERVREVKDPQQ